MPPETRYKKLWFGLTARATIGPGFIHKSGIGQIAIPHPPVANWLLRWGMSDTLSRDLSFDHEFAHLQTMPAFLGYTLGMLGCAIAAGTIRLLLVLYVVTSVQCAWEIVSEALVWLQDPVRYRESCKTLRRLPRILFWIIAGLLAVTGWVALFIK